MSTFPLTLHPAASGNARWIIDLAQAWGSRPAPALAIWLLLVGGTAFSLSWTLQRDATINRPLNAPLRRGAVLWMLVATALWLVLAWEVSHDDLINRLDVALAHQLSLHVPPALLHMFGTISHLADTPVLTVACVLGAILLWLGRSPVLAIGWIFAIAGNAVLNVVLKDWVGRVRPEHLEGYTMAGGLSFPSGHSSGALVAYGMLAWIVLHVRPQWPLGWRVAVLTLSALAIAAVGYSRMGLQVHYVSDVLGGWLSGSVWLILSMGLVRWLERRRLNP